MLNSKAFANAATAVVAGLYVACVLLSYISPDFLFGIAQSWIHSLNLEAVKGSTPMSTNTLIIGLLTISLLTWVVTYATIELYNRWAKIK